MVAYAPSSARSVLNSSIAVSVEDAHTSGVACGRGMLCWMAKLKIAHGIALGMQYLHTLDSPIVHRDLKPANILISEDFSALIGDFGGTLTLRRGVARAGDLADAGTVVCRLRKGAVVWRAAGGTPLWLPTACVCVCVRVDWLQCGED